MRRPPIDLSLILLAREAKTMSQVETFNCPRCGGDIQYDGHGVTQRCPYCGAAVTVPVELRPKAAPSIAVVNPIGYTRPTRSAPNAGCLIGVVGFVALMVIVTVILPLTAMNQALNNIPDIPGVMKDVATMAAEAQSEPTRRPPLAAPSPTPTPAFADVVLQFGEKGMGPGQFTSAALSGMDGEGRVYVGEYAGGRIQVFDAAGKFLRQFFIGGKNSVLLGLAVDRSGVVFTTDGGDITRWDGQTGQSLGKLKYRGGPGFGELALAPDGSLYAMWYERRNGIFTSVEGAREDLVHFDAAGQLIGVQSGVISSMTDSVELSNALALDGRGNVYVAAEYEQTIFKFDANGKFITRLGSSGEGDSQFHNVGALAVDGQGRIFLEENGDISVLRPDGSRVGQIDVDGSAHCLWFDDQGALWVTTDKGMTKYQVKQK